MHSVRIYCRELLSWRLPPAGKPQTLALSAAISYKLIKVLRLQPEQDIILFAGNNTQCQAKIIKIEKKLVIVEIAALLPHSAESNIKIALGQAIAKNIKMDFIIQKAVELGVHSITPLLTTRTVVKIKEATQPIKVSHWQKIAIAACEQCGRNYIPLINQPMSFSQWLLDSATTAGTNIMLDPKATVTIKQLSVTNNIRLLIGPEGGFTQAEIDLARQHNFQGVTLGPRILRAETAAIAAICSMQLMFGDCG